VHAHPFPVHYDGRVYRLDHGRHATRDRDRAARLATPEAVRGAEERYHARQARRAAEARS
jgi:hypothetical protein